MRTAILVLILTAAIGGLAVLHAEDTDYKNHPGYIDLDKIEIPKTSESVTMIDLGPDILRIISKSDKAEADSSRIIAIHVRSFKTDAISMEKLEPAIDRIEEKIRKENWKQIIQVKEKDERTTVSLKYDEDRIQGLLVMSVEPDSEVTFVNIVGDFSLEDLGDLDVDIDDDTLDSLKESLGK